MYNIVLFGPPGAGKGTQAEFIKQKYDLIHISTGDLFRFHISNNTPLGKEVKDILAKGQLVPDEVTINILKEEVKANVETANGFIFDGFPRTQAQAEALDALLLEFNTNIDGCLSLEVPTNELVQRLLLRGKDSGREDDTNEEVINQRIDVYNSQTAPVKDFYDNHKKLHCINGLGSIEEITQLIEVVIEKF